MKRMMIAVLVLAFFAGCQKKTEVKTEPQKPETSPAATTAENEPQRPAMRPSDARITVDSPALAAGKKGSFGIHYFGVEPAKAMILPLEVPEGMHIDSVSFAGSIMDYLANKPVRIENGMHKVLIGGVPFTEPKIPGKEGLLATVYFTLAVDAKSGTIDESFMPPANFLSYVDTTNTLVQPYFEPGKLTVKQ